MPLETSSQDDKQPTKWPAWRVVMLVGALLLLALAIARATSDEGLPDWVNFIGNASGYALLVIGFGLAMQARGK